MRRLVQGIVLCAALVSGIAWAGGTELVSGQPTSLEMPAHSVTTSYYIDIGANAKQLHITLDGAGGDADLFVRHGTPFPPTSAGSDPMSIRQLSEYAHYMSIRSGSQESLAIGPHGREPLRPGRWHVAVSNAGEPTSLTITATASNVAARGGITALFTPTTLIDDCDTAPWHDTTAATPVGGNTGRTLGEQRRNAFNAALASIGEQLPSPVDITVQACWQAMGGDADRAGLAMASPMSLMRDAPSLPRSHTWYPLPTASRLSGVPPESLGLGLAGYPDAYAVFNSDIGKGTILGGAKFYLGLDDAAPANDISMRTIATHEVMHGIGFIGLANIDSDTGALGARYADFDDIFSAMAVILNGDDSASTPFFAPGVTDGERAAAMVALTKLRWAGPVAYASPLNPLNFLSGERKRPMLFSPCDDGNDINGCTTMPGSTMSHVSHMAELMHPSYQRHARGLGIAGPMMQDIGWDNRAATPEYAQPVSGNWFSPAHDGHGIDFQLVRRDPQLGDIHYVTFYTFDGSGRTELYTAVGRLVDGKFVGSPDKNGRTLYRVRHKTGGPVAEYVGFLDIDFNQAAQSPQCRAIGRSGSQLALMYWSIDASSGVWCVEPTVDTADVPLPDFNGHWYAPQEPGWGLELILSNATDNPPLAAIGLYIPDGQGVPRWLAAQVGNFTSGMEVPLVELTGYCRNCPARPLGQRAAGTIRMHLDDPLSASNRVDIDVQFADGSQFRKSAVPIELLSIPGGH